jgi:hypothetical protein
VAFRAPIVVKQAETGMEVVQDVETRLHVSLDDLGVPRDFFGTPLTLETRLRILFDGLSGQKNRLRAMFERRFKSVQEHQP